ncbi:TMEM175 family protein [Hamadaea tsunoensis]|uniref:TMEM175 family protein n=1 Tax=Hamadaea tsunoensis TaxID=53368 RepID=UPI000428C077|nr:TMEM175 family protein [Hamadaea tsunoensis]
MTTTAETTADLDEPGHSLERTIYFSDAVIAIALTLLALELPVPEGLGKSTHEVWVEFLAGGDEYRSFAISFAVISFFWWEHHRFFQRINVLSGRLVFLNMVSLFAIVVVPFGTRLLSVDNGGPLGPVFYASAMILWSLALILMVITANRQKLWRKGTPAHVSHNMIVGAGVAAFVFALSIPIAFAKPDYAEFSWLLIIVFSRLAGMLSRRTAKTPGDAKTPHRA